VKKKLTAKWSKYKDLVFKMINAESEEHFNAAYEAVLIKCGDDQELRKYFSALEKERESFSEYIIQRAPGNMLMRGSSISESNNSSVLAFIHDITRARSLEDLFVLLLKRQAMKESKTNKRLLEDHLHLQAVQRTATAQWQKDAANHLSLQSYKRFERIVTDSYKYKAVMEGQIVAVSRINNTTDAPPRKLTIRGLATLQDFACSCPNRVAYDLPCPHEICARGLLSLPFFRLDVDPILIPKLALANALLLKTIAFQALN
jgi:hypothetical protein